jgi:lipopolysaccharide exporter
MTKCNQTQTPKHSGTQTLPSMQQSRKNAAFALLEKGSGMVFALGTAMLLLRGLSKEDFAAWGLFLLVTYLLEMARAGLIQNGLVRHLALHREDPAVFVAIKRAALWLNFGFSIGSNLLLWLGMGWIITTWQVPQLTAVLPVYFITNFVMALFYHFNFLQQAQHEFRGIFQANVCFRGTLFFWVLLCKITGLGFTLQSLALAMLGGAALGTLASWRVLSNIQQPRFEGAIQQERVLDWIKKLASYGKWVLGTNLSTMFYKNVDKLTLGYLIGPAAFAVYDAAGKVTQMVEAPSFSIASVVFPQGAERMKQHGPAGVKLLYERSVGAILVLILLFPKPIMLIFAGPAYLESANILVITAFFGLFLPFAVQFGTILDATGKPQVNFAYTLFTALLNLGLNWWFIHQFGLPGAALATLTGYALSFIFMQYFLNKHFKINALHAFRHVPDFYRMGWRMVRNLKLT